MRSEQEGFVLPPGQFRIYRRAIAFADQKDVTKIFMDDFVLDFHRALPATTFGDGPRGPRTIILGTAFDLRTGDFVGAALDAEIHTAADQPAALEAAYDNLFGSFIIIVRFPDAVYMYLDAGGSLSAVYSQEHNIAGSTSAAILSHQQYDSLFQHDLYDTLDVINEGWFPAGLTAHRGVSRLLCNHRLNLVTMVAERHWPRTPPARLQTASSAVDAIASTISSYISVLSKRLNTALSLTGGSDSRTLLSLSLSARERLLAYTVSSNVKDIKMDVVLASRLASLAKIPHRILTPSPVPEADIDVWRRHCGHAVGGHNATLHVALRQLAGTDVLITGSAAETGRAFFWKKGDREHTPIDAVVLCRRFGMRPSDAVTSATQDWIRRTPKGDAFFILDLAYLELRVSPWAFAQSYIGLPQWQFSPFATRPVISAMLSLPVEFKRSDRMGRSIIERNWKELLDVPLNRFGDYRDTLRILNKLRNVRLVIKKIRKILAP